MRTILYILLRITHYPLKAIVKVNGVRYEPKDTGRSQIIIDIEGTNTVKLDASDSIFNANNPM